MTALRPAAAGATSLGATAPGATSPGPAPPTADPAAADPAPRLHVEHPPGPDLSPWVEAIWTRSPDSPAVAGDHRILPDGCADLVFRFGAAGGPRAFAVGAMTRGIVHREPCGEHWLGIRFRPGGAAALLGGAAGELTDRRVEAAAVEPDLGRLAQVLGETAGPQRVERSRRFLRHRLAAAPVPEPPVAALLAGHEHWGGAITVGRIAADLGVSRQHLARRVRRATGLSPKQLLRILRLRRVVAWMHRAGCAAGAAEALAAGYFDQAHMLRDFRSLAGCSPVRLLEERRHEWGLARR